jgi:hypothetical protein
MLGSDNINERENARNKLDELLRRHKLTWNDLPAELAAAATTSPLPDQPPDDDGQTGRATVNQIDAVEYLLREYSEMKQHEFIAVALWTLHTHVYSRFMHTPRLALTSPVRGCGKTNALDVLETLVATASKTDSITAAALCQEIDRRHPTMLLDEADNLGLLRDGLLRAIVNAGHKRGGRRSISQREYSLFAPMAYAAIGTTATLPLPLLQRSIVINMERHDGTRPLKRFDSGNPDPALGATYLEVLRWARTVTLELNPIMPEGLRNRSADNWRPLFAVADALGWGEKARAAAMEFAKSHQDEDVPVTLLRDIRDLFDERRFDRLWSETIIDYLVNLDDAPWSEWRGVQGDQQPRRLTQAQLADTLRLFGIRPRTVWLRNRRPDSRSKKGYYRSQFEQAWRSYCPIDGTPAQSFNYRRLRRA